MASMYCVKCRAKREDPNAQKVTMKNGKAAMKGKCPVCGTGMYKIGGQLVILLCCKTPQEFRRGFGYEATNWRKMRYVARMSESGRWFSKGIPKSLAV